MNPESAWAWSHQVALDNLSPSMASAADIGGTDGFVVLPSDPGARKDTPVCTGCLDYFPLALAEVARVSKAGNDQHNPGQPLHWDRSKSGDEADALLRHLMERGGLDVDNQRHSAKLAWRALALLQKELEEELGLPPSRASR